MATKIQLRRDTALAWSKNNPVLALGEPGLETDTSSVKYGNGVSKWNDLPYSSLIDEEKLTTANVVETANLYFSNARAYANTISIGYALSSTVNSQLALKADTTVLSNYATLGNLNNEVNTINSSFQTQINLKANINQLSTDFISEGANLYYTDQRAYSNIILLGYASNADVTAQISGLSFDFDSKANVSDLSNVYDVANLVYTKANVTELASYTPLTLFIQISNEKVDANNLNTSNVVDTANVYFSNTRAVDAVANTDIQLGNVIVSSVVSTVKVKLPSYSYDDMNALTAEAGEIVFETSNNLFMGYNGASWVQLG